MGKKTYPSGLLPADTVPSSPEKRSKGPDNLADRLEQMLGNFRSSPIDQVRTANRLHQEEDGRLLAEYLGVTKAFDALTRIRAEEETLTE